MCSLVLIFLTYDAHSGNTAPNVSGHEILDWTKSSVRQSQQVRGATGRWWRSVPFLWKRTYIDRENHTSRTRIMTVPNWSDTGRKVDDIIAFWWKPHLDYTWQLASLPSWVFCSAVWASRRWAISQQSSELRISSWTLSLSEVLNIVGWYTQISTSKLGLGAYHGLRILDWKTDWVQASDSSKFVGLKWEKNEWKMLDFDFFFKCIKCIASGLKTLFSGRKGGAELIPNPEFYEPEMESVLSLTVDRKVDSSSRMYRWASTAKHTWVSMDTALFVCGRVHRCGFSCIFRHGHLFTFHIIMLHYTNDEASHDEVIQCRKILGVLNLLNG